MSNGTLKVCRNCEAIIKEFRGYVWDSKCMKTGVDRPLKENDHCLDSLRYAIFSHFFGKEGVKSMTPQDIERNYAEAMGDNSLPAPFRDMPTGGYGSRY